MTWMYSLILTLTINGNPSMTTLIGFADEAACQKAAVQWAKAVGGQLRGVYAVCVRRDTPGTV